MAFDPVQPFVLLDDARSRGRPGRLFTDLVETVRADMPAEVAPALERLRAPGDWAGFIGFEAGYALEPALAAMGHAGDARAGDARTGHDGLPLLWFGRFAGQQRLDCAAVAALLVGHGPAAMGPVEPQISERDHAAMLAEIAALIAAGDIYQANATFQTRVAVSGHPLALYARLRAAQAAPYGALINTGAAWVLSASPELFFAMQDGQLTARPMKGTAPRGATRAADDAAAAALAADPKNRAENLMITDLLRNDLSRIGCGVTVPRLFHVERYPTVLQMTSTVTATAQPGVGPIDVVTALFPCGSVTGAPKIRAMEVIADVEDGPRGLYTGSIGYVSGQNAAFNVAIRTLILATPGVAHLGLGSGIVADSVAADEWQECFDKAAFLSRIPRITDLIETLRYDPGTGLNLRHRHLARLLASAARLDFGFDATSIEAALTEATRGLMSPARIRLLLAHSGAVAVQVEPLPPPLAARVSVALAPLPVAPSDWRLFHKTTDRGFYDDARRSAGTFEVVFVRPDGRITEGSYTNVFVERDGVLLTPCATNGLLPGVLRAEMLATGRAIEADLTLVDLKSGFFIGNALRGLIPARLRD